MVEYRMYKPNGILTQFVRFFWSLDARVGQGERFVHRTLPDNCLELIFYCKGKLSISSGKGDEGVTFGSGVFGQPQKYRQFRTEKDFYLFGVYLYPYSMRMLFNLPASELCNQKVDSETLWGVEGQILEEQVYSAECDEARIRVISRFLLGKLAAMRDHDTRLTRPIQSLIDSNTLYSISTLADNCNLSRRQLERKFKELSGLTPKDFFSIVRFKKALSEIQRGNRSLSQIAIGAGYYDQSHFTNEFKFLSGYTPRLYLINHQREVDDRATRDFEE